MNKKYIVNKNSKFVCESSDGISGISQTVFRRVGYRLPVADLLVLARTGEVTFTFEGEIYVIFQRELESSGKE